MTPGLSLNRLLGIVPQPRRVLNVFGYVAHGEKWVWIYKSGKECELLKSACKMAANPALVFTHYDAAMIGHKLRQVACERKLKGKKWK